MSKLFGYRHVGEGGCNRIAFYTLTRPQPGESLADCVIISVAGHHIKQEGALMCGHCGNGVLGLKLEYLKPSKINATVDLLVRSVNNTTVAKAEIQVLTEHIQLLHELCSKIDPKLVPYVGSELEASIIEVIGYTRPAIVDADGAEIVYAH